MLVLSELQLNELDKSPLTKSDKEWVQKWVIKNSKVVVDEDKLLAENITIKFNK